MIGNSGATLIEVLLAALITAGVGLSFAYFGPIASKNSIVSRHTWIANQLAASTMTSIKQRPYPLLDLTDPSYFPVTGANGCDCQAVNFANLPVVSTQTMNGIQFKTQTCVSLTDFSGQPHCPPPAFADTFIKTVVVRVHWNWRNETRSVVLEGTSSRL